ncbi:WD repeat-containing protein 75 [Sitophilus oryzae]|uniref:WD repeat-containing protein 75 n=1 Tax=Sitophilus oryzae TaxID=7048 RepID=A0A6J2YBF6_SITOR|nr:WD repeat-containing protein 75 [Sitophilus oryzae]
MDISVNFKGGSSFIKLEPVFSTNGENIFVSSRNSLFEYNTRTGKLIYEYKGLKSNVIGFNCALIDDFECLIACSEDGQVIVWKVVFKVKIHEWQLTKSNLRSFDLISFQSEKGLEALVSFKNKNEKILFAVTNLKKGGIKTLLKVSISDNYAMDVSLNKYFSLVHQNTVHFVNLESKTMSKYTMSRNRTFTCVACHPNEQVVLTGDNTGRVVVWQDIFNKQTQAVFHWHNLPVTCLAFSASGSNFYSGGNECVLVKWQFDRPNFKQFLPRLPAELRHITVSENNAYLAVATSDNAIRIIDSRLNQINLIQNLVFGRQFESGIHFDPITRSLVLNGNTGCVQFYSPNDMSLLYNIDIVGQNKVTDERETKMENTEVRKLALSKTGKWLATVEDRNGEKNVCEEVRLKFWQFNTEKQIYELSTSIEYPHERKISNIAFQPVVNENLKCVTIGDDKKFKIWQVTESTNIYKTGLVWKCLSIGFYRHLPCKSLSFSADGSLFATAFESILTTWTPDSCELKCSLVHPSYKGRIKHVNFGQGNQCHLLVSATQNQVSVWNLLSLCMIWTVQLNEINLLVADLLSTYMAVICRDNKLFIFEPSNATALFTSDNLLNKKDKIVAAAFIPGKYSHDSRLKWYERSTLYYITEKNELYSISKSEEPFEYVENIEDLSEDTSIFSKIKAAAITQTRQEGYKNHLFEKDVGHKTFKEYLEAPLLTLAPVRLQAASILKSFILQKESVAT